MTPTYQSLRAAHFRLTLIDWFKGLDKALLGLAAALTFILTAIVAMLTYGLAQGLSLLQRPDTDVSQRLLVVASWQAVSLILLRALREAALMPRTRLFFDALPVPAVHKLRSDLILALLSYSFLWAPVVLCIFLSDDAARAGLSLAELVFLSLSVNLPLLRGASRPAWLALLGCSMFAISGESARVEAVRAGCAALGAIALWRAYLPGAVPIRARAHLSPLADRIALASGLVVPLLANELRANILVRVGCIAATLGACLTVIALRTNDASAASVVVFVAAVATLALYSLPALCRDTLLHKLHFLAGVAGFARRMRFAAYAIPTGVFAAALIGASMFDRSGTAARDAAVFSVFYVTGVAGTRLRLPAIRWFMPLACVIALIILSAML